MIRTLRSTSRWCAAFLLAGLSLACTKQADAVEASRNDNARQLATQLLAAGNTTGGLIVHVGCGDGRLTAALRAGEGYLVHGLDTHADRVAEARARIRNLGSYGDVSVDTFDGKHLPYGRETVNLLVASGMYQVPQEEMTRVLAPGGVLLARSSCLEARQWPDLTPSSAGLKGWSTFVKPRPADIDQWSHFLHDAGGNAVAADKQVGPPKRLRWVAGPRWCRSHEMPTSVNAVVTAGGRLFTIFDEGPTGVYEKMPWRCHLIARDAANGVQLWKVPMRGWQPEFGTGRGNRWHIHHTIPRRLVADGDRVYVTLGFLDSPISVLDAATGEVLIEGLKGTRGADEIILSDGVLITKITESRSVGATERINRSAKNDTLAAVDVATGEPLWRNDGVCVVPYALSAQAGRVVYHNLEELVCLDARTGDEIWRAPNRIGATVGAASTLVLCDGVVLFHGHMQQTTDNSNQKRRREFYLTALSLEDGKLLWKRKGGKGQAGACTQPTDLFVIDGTVWCDGSTEGYELSTGKVARTLSLGKLISPGHHYRCHRSKATERFLIWPKRGAEFIDLEGEDHMRHDWVRAPCFTGATPANGLLYMPSSQCFCYPGVKIPGYLAMSAQAAEPLEPASQTSLERGPAHGRVEEQTPETDLADDWPMYRRDPERSGSTTEPVPAQVERRWEVDLACEGTQPVIVDQRLWVAEKDTHRVRCLRVDSGEDVWSFTAGGRIDSAPTWHDGMLLFGCRDGRVYCLRAADGELMWRFRAAPNVQRIVSYGQLESLWPVHGSVLVQDDVVYFAAGRSSFLDGGILVYALDVNNGRLLHHHHLKGPWPNIWEEVGAPYAMEGALPDLIVSDGQDLYMGRIKFDARLNRLPTREESPLGELDMGANHLVATGGFLDDTGFDRLYWMYSHRWPGFYFAQHAPKSGQLLVFDDTTTYAVKYFYRRIQWSPAFVPGEQGYLLFADHNDNQPVLEKPKSDRRLPGIPQESFEKWRESLAEYEDVDVVKWLPEEAYADNYPYGAFGGGGRGVEKGRGYQRSRPPKWQEMVPLRIRAMVLAGDLLFAAGMPDVVDPDDPLAALDGEKGAVLQAFSAADGSLQSSLQLSSLPVFDGLCAARGQLYLVTQDGKIICFGPDR